MAYEGIGCEWHELPEPGFGVGLMIGVLAYAATRRL